MVNPISTALAGLNVAQVRVGVAAQNIANAQSTGAGDTGAYRALKVTQTAGADGGPRAEVSEKLPATVRLQGPAYGGETLGQPVEFPNVNLAEEIVSMKLASHSYRANIAVIDAAISLEDTLINGLARSLDQSV